MKWTETVMLFGKKMKIKEEITCFRQEILEQEVTECGTRIKSGSGRI